MANNSSNVSRRNVVIGLAVAGAAGGGTVAVPLFRDAEALRDILRPVGLGRRGVKLSNATSGDWAIQEGSMFTAETGHILKLASVRVFTEKTARPSNLRDKAFIAKFDVVKGGPIAGDKTYRFAHHEGGSFDMYLSSNSPTDPLRVFAIFN